MTPSELASLDAATIAAQVAARALSPVEVTEAALAAIDVIDPQLHAFTEVAREQALASARAQETAISRGATAGPLAGVPVPVKDLVFTKGIRTTFGSRLYQDFVPAEDDIVVERLRAAGAIIIGKTNVSEFGYGGVGHNPLFPATCNPWNPELTSGGSSAGSAVAVATGIAPIAIGSDGGGSIRLPAAFNGLFGMKASMGRVPLWPGCRDETLPGVSGWESIEHIGPISRTVADAALMLSVIAGPDPRDRHSIPCLDINWLAAASRPERLGMRVAYCREWGGVPVHAEVREICDSAVAVFAGELDCEVILEGAPEGFGMEMFRAVVAMDTDCEGLRRVIGQRHRQVGPRLSALLAQRWTGDDFMRAGMQRKAAANAMARFMARYDLLLTPTVPCPPFPVGLEGPGRIGAHPVDDDAWTPALFPANLTGQPAASIPAGMTTDGLPVGLQLVGRHLDDAAVLQASAAFERARPWMPSLMPLAGHARP
jgi:aspartyl-tRNA(Asn)/glutamyl-tRNA(Gln) amidotransferase subunit A